MKPIEAIRRHVLSMSQTDFAAKIGVNQSTISRWESGEGSPTLVELENIRALAASRRVKWRDVWFFECAPSPLSSRKDVP